MNRLLVVLALGLCAQAGFVLPRLETKANGTNKLLPGYRLSNGNTTLVITTSGTIILDDRIVVMPERPSDKGTPVLELMNDGSARIVNFHGNYTYHTFASKGGSPPFSMEAENTGVVVRDSTGKLTWTLA